MKQNKDDILNVVKFVKNDLKIKNFYLSVPCIVENYESFYIPFKELKIYLEKIYKEALKINPEDEDTRYNLAYALKKIQQQQQQQQQQDKEEKKDEKKDKEKEKQEQQKQQNQEKQINPQDAQRILDALNQQEKNVQDKRKMQMIQKRPANGKQW
ncbi:MAG: tetratricopeptide repeat protein [Bacteroidales bacterium]|nr:tetratricopeptide repeat protein [Bacteroidales bacterium]